MVSARSYIVAALLMICAVHGVVFVLNAASAVSNTHPKSLHQVRLNTIGTLLVAGSPNRTKLNTNGTLLVVGSHNRTNLNSDSTFQVVGSPNRTNLNADSTLQVAGSPNRTNLNADSTLQVEGSPKQARLNAAGKLVVDSPSPNRTVLKEYHIKGVRPSVNLGLKDRASRQLGKYNWTLDSKDELQQWDKEATKLMKNLKCHNFTKDPPDAKLPRCPCVPPNLQGALEGNFSVPTWAEVDGALPPAMNSGTHRPDNCRAQQKVAVIIPFREREQPLKVLLRHLHFLLRRQQAHYVIYVVEQLLAFLVLQIPGMMFNKAILMNVGFLEARRTLDADCYIFHDVDLISMDDRLLYRCDPVRATHLTEWIDKYNNKKAYAALVGGGLAFPRALFEKVNGYSNLFYGWGGEDDEMFYRLRAENSHPIKPPKSITRYHAVKHDREKANTKNKFNLKVLQSTKSDANKKTKRFQADGLSSLNYTVVARVARRAFMHLYIEPVSALLDYILQPDTFASCAKVYNKTTASLPGCADLCNSEHACAGFNYNVGEKTQCHRFSSLCLADRASRKNARAVSPLYIRSTLYVPEDRAPS